MPTLNPSPSLDASHSQEFTGSTRVLTQNSVRGQTWLLKEADQSKVFNLARDNQIDESIARILVARGVTSEVVDIYLNPTLRHFMPDPEVLTDMDKATRRLSDAIIAGETIGIFGDYDVDGVTASSLLYLYSKELGLNVEVYLPDRVGDGYGPSIGAFEALQARGANLIVTVDCGASAQEPIEAAGQLGIEVIVIDHHQMSSSPPERAVAVVNPNRRDDVSGLGNLSAVGVTFMLLVALNRTLRKKGFFEKRLEPDLKQWLDIVALGLICDVMQVTGLTRALIAQGLKVMDLQMQNGKGGNPGISALARRTGVKGKCSPYHLGFLIGPRINAAGRIGHADIAFQLLTTPDDARRQKLAEQLHVMNADRQEIEKQVFSDAIGVIEAKASVPELIICAGLGWHPGVIGIVAGRLKERFDRPAIVIGLDEAQDGSVIGKGSGRSITGVDLGAAISAAREEGILVAGGGHAMAAGLTIAGNKIEAFKEFITDYLRDEIATALSSRNTKIDDCIAPMAVTGAFANLIAEAGPFGPGNAEPIFMLEDVNVHYPKVVGEAHISCTLKSDGGDEVRAIAFRAVEEPLEEALKSGKRLHLVGRIKADEWRGGNAGQFQIMDAAYA